MASHREPSKLMKSCFEVNDAGARSRPNVDATLRQSRRHPASKINYAQFGGIDRRMSSAEVTERSAVAVRLVAEGQATSQAAAAAMAGVSAMNVSNFKLKDAPPFSTIRRPESRFELVEVAPGVSYEKEFRVADGLEEPTVANCRAQQNYRRKKAALQEAARRAEEARRLASDPDVAGGGFKADQERREYEFQPGAEEEDESDPLWDELEGLNHFFSGGSGCGGGNGRDVGDVDAEMSGCSCGDGRALSAAIIARAGGAAKRGRMTRSYQPHEKAALTLKQRTAVDAHRTVCICSRCGDSGLFSIDLGRATMLQSGSSAMHGADAFLDHPVSLAVLKAEAMMNECGWRQAVIIPQRHCCHFSAALKGSAMRAEAAALNVWRRELDLDAYATRAVARALRVPLFEPTPSMMVTTRLGQEQVQGKASVYVLLSKADVLPSSNPLRRLWGSALTKTLVASYEPLLVDEELATNMASNAISMGDTMRAPLGSFVRSTIRNGNLMLAVLQVDDERHAAAVAASAAMERITQQNCHAGFSPSNCAAHGAEHVRTIRDALRASGASHLLLPNGAKLDRPTEELANDSEAAAINSLEGGSLNISADSIHKQYFNREGSSSGVLDAESVVERLGQSYDVNDLASRDFGGEMEFLAAADHQHGLRAAAIGYIAGSGAKARKRKAADGGNDGHLRDDGPGQPRMIRAYNAIPGVHIDGAVLKELQHDHAYMSRVRCPQMLNTMQCLLTLRHLGYGGGPVGHSNNKCPLAKASSTVVRVCSEHDTVGDAAVSLAGGTIASVNCGCLAVHVDGAAQRREPTAEIVTTRWAQMMKKLRTTAAKEAALEEARKKRPLQSTTLFLRSSIAFSVAPCSGLGIVAGSEDEHGVPEPEADESGDDVERGMTRSFAQSLRPDEATAQDLPSFDDAAVRRAGLRRPPPLQSGPQDAGASGAPRQAAGANRPARVRQAPQQFVPGVNNNQLRQQQLPYYRRQGVMAPAQGYGRARVNRMTGVGY